MADSVHGEWWRADRPEERLSGELSLQEGGPELSVLGPLTDGADEVSRSSPVKTVPLIFGRTEDGDSYTLLDAWQRAVSHVNGTVKREVLRPRASLRGHHLEHDDLLFDRMLVDLFDLEALAGYPNIDVDTDVGEGGWPRRATLRADRTVHLEGKLGTDAVRLVSAPQHGGGGQRSTIGLDVYFEVVPDEPSDWNRLIDGPAGALSDLTTLALTHPAAIRKVRLHSIAGTDTDGRDRVWVELLIPFRRPRVTRSSEGWLASFHILFSASDAPDQVISRWGDVVAEHGSVIPLVFAPAYAPFIYSEHRFTSIVQAAEALHDQLHGSQDLSTEQHNARVNAVLATELPPEHAQWVADVLRSANSPPFRRKIERLLADCPPLAERTDVSELARRIVKTRNPLAHGALHRQGMLDHVERHWVAEILRFVISWDLLIALGITRDDASERVARHLDFRHAVDAVADSAGTTS